VLQLPRDVAGGVPVVVTRSGGEGRGRHPERLHAHAFFSLVYVHRGRGAVRFAAGRVPIAEGSVTIAAPGVLHDARDLQRMDRTTIEFTPDAFGAEGAAWLFPRPAQPEWLALLRRSGEPRAIVIPPAERAAWCRRLASLHAELRDRRRGYREAVRAELKLLLVHLARHAVPEAAPEPLSPLLGEVFDVVESRFAAQLSLADVARAVGRSPGHLTTLVRRQTGMTVQQWIIERRMAEARQRLLGTDETVQIVAERAGYADATLFIRHFKRAHGVTPGEWRRAAVRS